MNLELFALSKVHSFTVESRLTLCSMAALQQGLSLSPRPVCRSPWGMTHWHPPRSTPTWLAVLSAPQAFGVCPSSAGGWQRAAGRGRMASHRTRIKSAPGSGLQVPDWDCAGKQVLGKMGLYAAAWEIPGERAARCPAASYFGVSSGPYSWCEVKCCF